MARPTLKKTPWLLVVGIGVGFIATELAHVILSGEGKGGSSPHPASLTRGQRQMGKGLLLNGRGGFVPDSPHSHGEMDAVAGPDVVQKWNDEEDDNHKG